MTQPPPPPPEERSDRRLLLIVWGVVAALIAVGVVYVPAALAPGPSAGRGDPARIYSDNAVVVLEPGVIGEAVELKVAEDIRACMERQGQRYDGLAEVSPLDGLLSPGSDGYGIAGGPKPEFSVAGAGALDDAGAEDRDTYETALYGKPLRDVRPGDPVRGCAAAGRNMLDESVATIRDLPYTFDALEADLLADRRTVVAMGDWSECMADRGHRYGSPEEIIIDLRRRLSTLRGEEAASLAEEERRIASDDASCRKGTLDSAIREIAQEYGSDFVQRNRPQLEALIPPPEDEGVPNLPDDLGTGDVQVTLVWSSTVDLDLAIEAPGDERVDFSDRTSVSGGELDRDANFPCDTATEDPVENIFWPEGRAPSGGYEALVTYRGGCGDLGEQRYQLIVRVDGRVVQNVDGRITVEEVDSVGFRR